MPAICPSCDQPLAEGARFCANCGASVQRRCPHCQVVAGAQDKYCRSCGGAIDTERPHAERRLMAVLFCDLVGSTALSQKLDPEDLRDLIRLYHQTGSEAIGRYEGYVAKFLGDGIMAFFGFPVAHEDDSKRSILAGLAILEAVQRINPDLEKRYGIQISVRVGIHTGLVVAGEMGSTDRPVMDIVGETPNVAARLQEHAPLNSVVVSADTHRLTSLDFEFESLGEKEMKGVDRLVEVLRVLAPSENGDPSRGRRHMVGRKKELAHLKSAWKQAREGKGHCVLLSGEPGIGKSTLVNSMVDHVNEDDDSAVVYVRCSPYHQNSPFFPLVEYLRGQLHLFREDAPDIQLDKLMGFVESRGYDAREAVPILAPLLGIPYEHLISPPALSPEGRRIKTLETLMEMAAKRSADHSMLLILDNVHWADPSTIELFTRILERLSSLRMLAIATYRPYYKPDWRHLESAETMRLDRLEEGDMAALVRQAAGAKPLPQEIIDHIIEKTDGVPLFIEELTKAIIESGAVKRGPKGYELIAPIRDLAIPTTLHGSLVARFERVTARKDIAQVAAVIGREFTPEVVAAVAHVDSAIVDRELLNLVSAELIYPVEAFSGSQAYRFRHALIQDAAYDSLLKSVRQQYHSEIAQTMESRFADTAEEQPEVVAAHYSSAGMVDAALQWWSKAGQKALGRSANVEAIAHFSKGLELVEQLVESPAKIQQELAMLIQRGTALIATKGFAAPEVGETFRRAEQICQLIGETPLLFPVIWGLWVYHLVRSDLEVSVEYAEQMLRLAEISGESGMFLEGHFTLGDSLFWLGRLEESKEHLDKAWAMYDPAIHRLHTTIYGQDPGVSTLCYSAYTYWHLGLIDQAYGFIDQAQKLAEESQHPFSVGWALAFNCSVRNWTRDYEEAKRWANRCQEHCSQQGQAFWLSASIASVGIARYYLGDRKEGLEVLRQGLAGYEMTGSIVVTPLWRALLAEVLVQEGELTEALQVVEAGLATVEQYHEWVSEPALRKVKGDIFRAGGHVEQAEREYLLAFELAMKQGSRMRALQVAIGLCRLEGNEANRARLRDIYSSFAEGIDRKDLEEARRLLSE